MLYAVFNRNPELQRSSFLSSNALLCLSSKALLWFYSVLNSKAHLLCAEIFCAEIFCDELNGSLLFRAGRLSLSSVSRCKAVFCYELNGSLMLLAEQLFSVTS